jgi:hypothetical protein
MSMRNRITAGERTAGLVPRRIGVEWAEAEYMPMSWSSALLAGD